MKYLIRSVKYFFYFAALTTLIITALVITGLAESDIDQMFRGGASAIWKIAVFFVAVAAVYPRVGFISRKVNTDRQWSEIRSEVMNFLEERNFKLESESGNTVTFRHRRPLDRLTRMYEDRITLTFGQDGFEMEGLRKDVFRLATGLEYRLTPRQQA